MAIQFTDCGNALCLGQVLIVQTSTYQGPLLQSLDCPSLDNWEIELVNKPEVAQVILKFNGHGYYVDLLELVDALLDLAEERGEESPFEPGWDDDIDLELVGARYIYVPQKVVDEVPSLRGSALLHWIPF